MLHCRCPARLAGWNWRTYPFDRTSSSTSAVLSFTFCRRRSGLVEELIREQHDNRRRRFRSLSRIHAKFFASHSLPSNATRQLSHSLSLSRTHTHTDTRTLSFTLSFAFFASCFLCRTFVAPKPEAHLRLTPRNYSTPCLSLTLVFLALDKDSM